VPPIVSLSSSIPPLPRGQGARTAGVVLAGVAVALAATGGYFDWRARADAQEISDLFARGGDWNAHAADVDARGRAEQRTANTMFLLASVSAIAGAASYAYGWMVSRR
jgi:hypothetical protein